jgi:serine/threonine protein kinase
MRSRATLVSVVMADLDSIEKTGVTVVGKTIPGRARPDERVRIGRYAVEEILGSGGMGVVYLAFDPELDRRVAIKVLPLRSSHDTPARQRLVAEAQAMARLAHPNVVEVYHAATTEDEVYIVMELVAGVTLREWIRSSARSVADVLEVFDAAGRGLAAAHAVGLVHRDFKPDNVLLALEGDRVVAVKVADFGLASSLGHVPTSVEGASTGPFPNVRLTQTGTVLGTPQYMAPEQWRGSTDARSDQFSFAVATSETRWGQRCRSKASTKRHWTSSGVRARSATTCGATTTGWRSRSPTARSRSWHSDARKRRWPTPSTPSNASTGSRSRKTTRSEARRSLRSAAPGSRSAAPTSRSSP